MATPVPAWQIGAYCLCVINLTIEDKDMAAAGQHHRLVPCRRQIDNCQPPVAKRNARLRLNPDTAVIGPTVSQAIGHCANQPSGLVNRIGGTTVQKTG